MEPLNLFLLFFSFFSLGSVCAQNDTVDVEFILIIYEDTTDLVPSMNKEVLFYDATDSLVAICNESGLIFLSTQDSSNFLKINDTYWYQIVSPNLSYDQTINQTFSFNTNVTSNTRIIKEISIMPHCSKRCKIPELEFEDQSTILVNQPCNSIELFYQFLLENPYCVIKIVGKYKDVITEQLASKRALKVKSELVELGVDPERLKTATEKSTENDSFVTVYILSFDFQE